jgi:hypothetical protein
VWVGQVLGTGHAAEAVARSAVNNNSSNNDFVTRKKSMVL